MPTVLRRPERAALVVAVIVVAGGGIAAGVRVGDGIADSRVDYHGKLDTRRILDVFQPAGRGEHGNPLLHIERIGYGYLSSGEGVMTVPRPTRQALALWSIQELAPWLLAAIVLALLAPLLRAAERGDPFRKDAARRLSWIGSLLLIGIPAFALFQWVVAETASAAAPYVEPGVEPSATLSLGQVLPGVLVLVVAGIFRHGVELRELERHTI